MRDTVKVEMLAYGKAGVCVLCGLNQALTRKVIYYNQWSYLVCLTCGRGIARHVRWLAEARRRHLQIRTMRPSLGE